MPYIADIPDHCPFICVSGCGECSYIFTSVRQSARGVYSRIFTSAFQIVSFILPVHVHLHSVWCVYTFIFTTAFQNVSLIFTTFRVCGESRECLPVVLPVHFRVRTFFYQCIPTFIVCEECLPVFLPVYVRVCGACILVFYQCISECEPYFYQCMPPSECLGSVYL